MDELKDIYGSKDMNRVKKVNESKDVPGFIDIHCHVLPMVDDGAESMEILSNSFREMKFFTALAWQSCWSRGRSGHWRIPIMC